MQKYDLNEEPSQYVASVLSPFVTGFSFIHPVTSKDNKLPVKGFRLVPNTGETIQANVNHICNNFHYFMLTRIFPYFQFYHDFEKEPEVILVIVYFDYAVEYKLNVEEMQLNAPSSAIDLQPALESIKRVSEILYVDEGLTEICLNQAVNPRTSFETIL